MQNWDSKQIPLEDLYKIGHFGRWRVFLQGDVPMVFADAAATSIVMDDPADSTEPLEAYARHRCHPTDVARVQREMMEHFETPGHPYRSQYRVWNIPARQWRWVQVFGASYLDERGRPTLEGAIQDIHESVAFQASMAERREAEERMQIMLDATPLCCNFWDENFNNIDCNQEAANLFDLPNKQAYLDHFFELSPELQPNGKPTSEEALRHITAAFENGREVFQWMHQKLDGTPIPSEITLVRVKRGEKHIVVGYTRDLRQLMASEAERREAEERTQIMLDATPLCCNFWDENFNNIDCNQEAADLFDLPNKQAYLDHFFELSPEIQPNGKPTSEEALRHITAAFENGREVFQWMHQKLDGTPIPAEITLVRVRRGDKYIVAGYTRDLRALKAAEVERDRERTLLRQVLDSSPVCFTILVKGVVQFATPFCQDFLGIRVGDRMVDYFARIEDRDRIRDTLFEGKSVDWWSVPMKTRDGVTKEMIVNLFNTDYYGEEGVMQWLVDVTEMRRVEADLRVARDAAEQSARAKSEFLANMSHEIRTPMNAILGMTSLVLRTDLNDKQRDYLQKTEYSANALLRIINDILDFSKIEAGKLTIENVEFELKHVVDGVLDMAAAQIGARGLRVSAEADGDIPRVLKGDPLRLNQVLMNLLSNAVKFTSQGQITLGMREQARDARHVKLLFWIKDSGIGMTEAQVAGLFQPFTQADASTTRKYGGTGLGLTISKSLVNLMGGEIWCASAQGEGSTFFFTIRFELPEHEQGCLAQLADTPAETEHQKIGSGRRILLAEDNEINQIVAEELLQIEGFRVDIANNGREAIDKLPRGDYDMVLMDIQMPEMDGITAAGKIRDMPEYRDLPIIAMTAHAMTGDREKSLISGMNDHITKPIDPETMYKTIAKWLPERKP